jgi:flagellum-specific peptidoglycan hydrolase FlgJ
MKPEQFLDMLLPAAQACHAVHGIPASFTLAQAALESSWGASKLANSGCNLFGVKADPSWHGATTMIQTREVLNGQSVMVPGKWRCYKDWGECLDDRAAFFQKNKRYAACFKETTGEGWARAVAAAGYATDPDYAEKLLGVMRGRNLQRFDQPPKGTT